MGLGLSVFPTDISMGQIFFFCFTKMDIFCLKNLHPDFSTEKKTCPTHVTHCRRGEAISSHLSCPSNHSAAARVGRTLLMQNTEAAQSPHSMGNAEFHCPEGERKILVLAVAPFSGPELQLLTALLVPKAVPAELVCGIF